MPPHKVAKQISIDYQLWEDARERAEQTGMSLSAFISNCLDRELHPPTTSLGGSLIPRSWMSFAADGTFTLPGKTYDAIFGTATTSSADMTITSKPTKEKE